jgi:transcriptional regulator with XRE-family HTH domain
MFLTMQTFDFRAWFSQARASKRKTFRALAAETKISPGHLNNLEKGTAAPTDDVLVAIAAALEVNPDWLLAQVDTTRLDPARIERLRKYAPAFLGLAAEEPPTYGEKAGDGAAE